MAIDELLAEHHRHTRRDFLALGAGPAVSAAMEGCRMPTGGTSSPGHGLAPEYLTAQEMPYKLPPHRIPIRVA